MFRTIKSRTACMTSFPFFPGWRAPLAKITNSRGDYPTAGQEAIVWPGSGSCAAAPGNENKVPKNLPVKILAPLALVAFAAASLGVAGAAGDRPVVIGAIYNLTGGQQNLDIPSSQGARLAVDLANERGGVLGRQVRMILVDGETKPDIIAEKTRKLIADEPEIAGLIGLSDTDMVLAAAKVAAERRLVFLTSGATSPLLPEQVPEICFSPASATTYKPRPERNGPMAC